MNHTFLSSIGSFRKLPIMDQAQLIKYVAAGKEACYSLPKNLRTFSYATFASLK